MISKLIDKLIDKVKMFKKSYFSLKDILPNLHVYISLYVRISKFSKNDVYNRLRHYFMSLK